MESFATAMGDTQEPQAPSAGRSPISIRYGATEQQHIRLPSGPPQLPPTTPTKRVYYLSYCCTNVTEGPPQWKERWKQPPWLTDVLKCGLAYFIASLFTFVPALSNLLSMRTETDVHGRPHPRPAYSAHMVATIVVYVSCQAQDIS